MVHLVSKIDSKKSIILLTSTSFQASHFKNFIFKTFVQAQISKKNLIIF